MQDDTKKAPPYGVVAEDPSGTWWDGSLVPPPEVAAVEARGVVVLPTSPDLVRVSPVAGFFKRSWGGGWPIDSTLPAMHSPMLIFCLPGYELLHWAARLVPASQAAREDLERGQPGALRLACDTSQRGVPPLQGFAPGERTAVALRDLGKADSRGGWTVRGSAVIRVARESFVPLAIYGSASGLRVAWAAVSQSQ